MPLRRGQERYLSFHYLALLHPTSFPSHRFICCLCHSCQYTFVLHVSKIYMQCILYHILNETPAPYLLKHHVICHGNHRTQYHSVHTCLLISHTTLTSSSGNMHLGGNQQCCKYFQESTSFHRIYFSFRVYMFTDVATQHAHLRCGYEHGLLPVFE